MKSDARQPCERCHGLGFIRKAIIVPGEPQTVTVIEIKNPEVCPECGGSGASDK